MSNTNIIKPINIIGLVINAGALYFVNSKQGKELIKNDLLRKGISVSALALMGVLGWKLGKNIQEYIIFKKYQNDQIPANPDLITAPGPGAPITTDPGTGQTIDLPTIATKIHDSFIQGWDLFGWYSQDQDAITALIQVPPEKSPQLARVYFALFSRNLKADLIEHLSDEELKGINDWLTRM